MISPNNNSVDYGSMLKTPAGYVVDFAIATTYSLDLHALMGAYLSLGLSVDTDSSLAKDPMYLFAALSEMKDKVIVFCEKGRISGRGDYSALYCQLESGIVEVDLPEASTDAGVFPYPSFHPKTWLIRFVPTSGIGPARYRMCILSRNLTFDSSWDLSGSFDGDYREKHKHYSDGGYSIKAYLKSLKNLYGEGEYSAKLKTMIDEVAYVKFPYHNKGFDPWVPFSFTGAAGAKSFNQEFSQALKTSSRALVITPFLSASTDDNDPIMRIKRHFEYSAERPLIVTRRTSIAANSAIANKLNDFSVFAMRDDLVTAEFEQDEIADDANKGSASDESGQEDVTDDSGDEIGAPTMDARDIHAKAYLFERAEHPDRCDLFVGSANASIKGLFANHEAMMHLVIERASAFDRLLGELGLTAEEIEKGSLFEPLTAESIAQLSPPSEDEQNNARKQQIFDYFLRKASLSMRIVKRNEDAGFDVIVTIQGDAEVISKCKIALATERYALPMDSEITFAGVPLIKLTELVRISVEDGDFKSVRLLKCELLEGAGYLEQQRRELFKSVTKGRFSEYLEFRLSGNPELVAALAGKRHQLGVEGKLGSVSTYSGLYENLLRAYTLKPEQTDALVAECLQMLTSERNGQEHQEDEEIEEIKQLLEIMQKGAHHAR